MAKIKEENIIRSSLWAAYGDAIGFPAELVSASEFKKRNSVALVSKPIAFTRRVGGMFGPDIAFHEGTYSDDSLNCGLALLAQSMVLDFLTSSRLPRLNSLFGLTMRSERAVALKPLPQTSHYATHHGL
ncbi:MAG: hypothetical protein U5O12_14570 [Rhodoferax sp.]|nr:hypothetical protein [Rhodoferax sp.]MDZ7921194.1 hypothetical protein [Rhodoferax sp.]